jgi:hypothetical protein
MPTLVGMSRNLLRVIDVACYALYRRAERERKRRLEEALDEWYRTRPRPRESSSASPSGGGFEQAYQDEAGTP